MTDPKFRHELKHYVTAHDCHLIRSRIRHLLQKDEHCRNDGTYHVRTLYFDNTENKVLNEKLAGVDNRDKWRIRIYNYSEEVIRLEKKSKSGGRVAKTSRSLTREECDKLCYGDIAWLRDAPEALMRELYYNMVTFHLKPRTIIDYSREAYVYGPGNVRVTFDSNIRSGLHRLDFFSRNMPTVGTLDPTLVILEVKYDEYLPDVVSYLLQLGNRERLSVSKYALGRIYG